jgi:hypothetical protein
MPAFWGVVRSLPQREKFAAERVEALGYPVFLPLVPTKRSGANEGRPLFAGCFTAPISGTICRSRCCRYGPKVARSSPAASQLESHKRPALKEQLTRQAEKAAKRKPKPVKQGRGAS